VKVIFNGQISSEPIAINANNRALQFGDGLFETIIVHNNVIRFFDSHLARLTRGAKALGLTNELLEGNLLSEAILHLIKTNGMMGTCRVKVMLWRQVSSKIGYSTDSTKSESLITVKPGSPPTVKTIGKVSISNKVFLYETAFSKFKTLSALPYVVASIERDERQLDELIISSGQGHIAECIASNIFWINDDQLFTPPLSTGCIEGVMRKQIISVFEKIGNPVKEKSITVEDLYQQDLVFNANVSGLSIFKSIDDQSLKTEHRLIDIIKQQLVP
jgi:4-amino-4-deoxychorismate lyase